MDTSFIREGVFSDKSLFVIAAKDRIDTNYMISMSEKNSQWCLPQPPSHASSYRPDIDGLRAVAVFSVVIFHAFPSLIRGGFVGVDIFFVISGYLISRIIFNEINLKKFSLVNFYSRRVRRIFPALLLILVSVFVVGWLILFASEFKMLGMHIAAGAGFFSNIAFYSEVGYFDPIGETKPLLHLWSLGIEEQFYILFPFLLLVFSKLRIALVLPIILFLLLSFCLNIYLVTFNQAGAFYLPQTRFWELCCGSLLAWIEFKNINYSKKLPSKEDGRYSLGQMVLASLKKASLQNLISVVGVVLIGIALLQTDKKQFPGLWPLLPIVGTVFLIYAEKSFVAKILSFRPIVYLGLISYPLYLWHWPILSFTRIMEGEAPSEQIQLTAVLISIVAASATYEIVEKPLRNIRVGASKLASVLMGFMLIIGTIGWATYTGKGFPFRMDGVERIASAIGKWTFPGEMSQVTYNDGSYWQTGSSKKHATLFIGDSTMSQYSERVESISKNPSANVNDAIFFTRHGCLAISGVMLEGTPQCDDYIKEAVNLALSSDRIQTVVLTSQWAGAIHSEGEWYINLDGNKLMLRPGEPGYRIAMNRLRETLTKLNNEKKHVVLLLSTPFGDQLDPKNLISRKFTNIRNFISSGNEVTSVGMSYLEFSGTHTELMKDLVKIARDSGAIVINPVEFLCGVEYCPSVSMDGTAMYMDRSHLNPDFVRSHVHYIDSTLIQQMKSP